MFWVHEVEHIQNAEKEVWLCNKSTDFGFYRCKLPFGFNHYIELNRLPLIYEIYVEDVDKIYIGSSFDDFYGRFLTHLKDCRGNNNKRLYIDLQKYKSYVRVLEVFDKSITKEELLKHEAEVIKQYWSHIEKCCLDVNFNKEDADEVHQKYMYNITLPSIK